MNDFSVYKVLCARPIRQEPEEPPVLGFSYRLKASDGAVVLHEHGTNFSIILWQQDGPELADLTEEQVKARIEEVLSK